MWELGGTVLQINCLTNTERLLEQLRETGASHLVCDSFNIEQGLNLRQQLESLKHVIQVGESEGHEDVVTVKSLMEAETNTRIGGGKFDWDKAPICLMFTTRNGESKIVKHTNKSLTAQVFSPKGASNNWFDQVIFSNYSNSQHFTLFVRMSGTPCSAPPGSSISPGWCAGPCARSRASLCTSCQSTVTSSCSGPWPTLGYPMWCSTPGRSVAGGCICCD